MKFLVDAQLPRRLAHWLTDARFDAIHTLDLPDANKTNDTQISAIADQDGRAVITKDDDFMYAHLAHGRPERLLLVRMGNISNADLLHAFDNMMPSVAEAFLDNAFVEMTRSRVIAHG